MRNSAILYYQVKRINYKADIQFLRLTFIFGDADTLYADIRSFLTKQFIQLDQLGY